jgi:nucleoside-diphosphate-sugar epimerase
VQGWCPARVVFSSKVHLLVGREGKLNSRVRMLRHIFVTGASGFIGKNLIQRHAVLANRKIRILTRLATAEHEPRDGSVERVVGDLLKSETYQEALVGCDAVVHMAAATGRATPEEYHRVNVEGTRKLLQACKTAGVSKFLHVSTIAAGYSNQRYYDYAKTKAQAEALVMESGLDYLIVRPTLVLGENSPIWKTLAKIAGLPIIPLPEGQPVLVQPIEVNDVVRGIEHLLARERFDGEILELGGPDQMPFREFLQLIQSALRGSPGKIVSVPLAPIRFGLAAIEPLLRPFMPVTAGQLAVFANNSVASDNWLHSELRADMPSTKETIAALVDGGDKGDDRNSRVARQMGEVSPLPERSQLILDEECRTFTTYLAGTLPSRYIQECYATAARTHGLAKDEGISCVDRAALKVARRGRFFARSADAYCALFCRNGALRRKLVLLAAILEHAAPTSEAFDRVAPSNIIRVLISLAAYGLAFCVSLLLGAAVLLPASILCWIATRAARSEVQVRRTP